MSDTTKDERGIVERMADVMADVSAVGKSGQNREQGYAFRPIDEFMNALHAPLSKHRVVVTPKVLDVQREERPRYARGGGQQIGVTRIVCMLVEYTFHAPNGEQLVVVAAGEGADVADKATNKAMAGALKYAIMQTFMVPTRDMTEDQDASTPDVPAPASRQQNAAAAAEAAPSTPPRADILAKLDEACEALGKTRAQLTAKWRKTHNVGAISELDDASKVSDVELYHYVVALQPYVDQAKRQAEAVEPESGDVTPPEPTAEEQQAKPVDAVICDATREVAKPDGAHTQKCTREAGHEGDHAWW